jgi:hypothetical protein
LLICRSLFRSLIDVTAWFQTRMSIWKHSGAVRRASQELIPNFALDLGIDSSLYNSNDEEERFVE